MNYHQYYQTDVINGPGTRATLFVSGCEHQCRGCYNQSTWNPCSGHLFDEQMQQRIIDDLNDDRIKRRGLSLSGGDPLFPANLEAILSLVKQVRAHCPGKDIWLWTGYTLASLSPEQQEIVDLVNVVVDGKFEQSLADPSLVFRGSSNQEIHYLR
ncbi:anaerobic ribonucleoside-triphosphate reductase-activating protein [Shewanella schlegeliana]|uniref:Anaerobic ribonucleoside-triphosphate reductase-activating protein n=1 Tax=Shewanella schlegeliana TaxID=190308 RepID=A0ABS1SXB2_9GAMM|nr:anaerobic ribonucleoside-triphosphate reductase-activating protein [Shewanella schlegeliana]MBL4913185.1 anaerobic ribonucleoside-triphosphate reductase-activating protein [Shewanella schlegeliana]MCL1109141.1 anaerobic ribonucleoside-triphosphate reductase-activating protein [Shewanella schlegeliana]GIU24059.1 anaerobic ribonucleoside-triphosphate reductase-activating protein [Shewanella schlegeliana]